jgi:hypothetical protein
MQGIIFVQTINLYAIYAVVNSFWFVLSHTSSITNNNICLWIMHGQFIGWLRPRSVRWMTRLMAFGTRPSFILAQSPYAAYMIAFVPFGKFDGYKTKLSYWSHTILLTQSSMLGCCTRYKYLLRVHPQIAFITSGKLREGFSILQWSSLYVKRVNIPQSKILPIFRPRNKLFPSMLTKLCTKYLDNYMYMYQLRNISFECPFIVLNDYGCTVRYWIAIWVPDPCPFRVMDCSTPNSFTFQDSWKTTFPRIYHAQNLSTCQIYFDKCFKTKKL